MYKAKFLVCAVVFSMAIIGCKKKAPRAVECTVLSYNVAGLPEGISSSHPDIYTTKISPLLNEIDVVHVQEDFHYHDSLLLSNTHPYRSEFMGDVFYGDGLNTFSKFPISNFSRTTWTDCADFDCYTPKGFSYSQIELAPGIVVDFYNVHMNAKTTPDAYAARQKNTRQLYNYINTHSAGKPVIMFGDFNSRYTRLDDSIRNILELGFKDSWIEVIRGGVLPVKDGNSLMNCGATGNDRTSADCEKVDKVFYRSSDDIEITPIAYKLDDIRYYYNNNDTMPLSDHWPLFTTFRVAEK